MIKTEPEFRKHLQLLSDKKIKEMVERIDVHNYPVLLLKEYSRRFGPNQHPQKTTARISKKLSDEKSTRRQAMSALKEEIKKLNEFNLSQAGLESLSLRSIGALHQKTNKTILEIKRAIAQIENSSKNIIALEKMYKEMSF